MPKVSIILTVYNIKHSFLKECLMSIQKQTTQDYEIIIINDCSKDDYDYLKEYPKVKYIKNEKNLGLCKSVNKAFSYVNSEYVIRLGSDDLFSNNLLEIESKFLDNNHDYIACCCDLQRFGKYNNVIQRPQEFTLNCSIRSVPNLYGYAGGMMFRASALKSCTIDERLKMCEDFDFHLQLLKLGKIRGINRPLYFYRQHESSVTKTTSKSERLGYLNIIYNKHHADDDLVSIIMPVHNTDVKYFTECLQSIFNQSYKKIELIIYNDGSKIEYNMIPIVREHRRFIHYYTNGKNLGISKTLNLACQKAHGKYLVRVDSDDILEKDFILKEYTFLKTHDDYVGCCCDLNRFGIIQGVIHRPEFNINNIHDVQSSKGYGYGCGMMFKRSALAKCSFDEKFAVCEDFDFHLQLLEIGKVKGLNECLYNYRQHQTSTIRQYNRIQRHALIKQILLKHKL